MDCGKSFYKAFVIKGRQSIVEAQKIPLTAGFGQVVDLPKLRAGYFGCSTYRLGQYIGVYLWCQIELYKAFYALFRRDIASIAATDACDAKRLIKTH